MCTLPVVNHHDLIASVLEGSLTPYIPIFLTPLLQAQNIAYRHISVGKVHVLDRMRERKGHYKMILML